jgi:hypothetical protein
MADVASFNIRFPEFCDEDDARIQLFLDDAALLMSSKPKWLDFYDVAHQYFAAHLLTVATASLSGDSGTMAPVRKQEVDDVVIEQAVADVHPNMDELLTTVYGKRYWSYRRVITVGIYAI